MCMTLSIPIEISHQRIADLTEREELHLAERTAGSKALYERARVPLSGGVASSYRRREPWPIYLERGDGPKVWMSMAMRCGISITGSGRSVRDMRTPRSARP